VLLGAPLILLTLALGSFIVLAHQSNQLTEIAVESVNFAALADQNQSVALDQARELAEAAGLGAVEGSVEPVKVQNRKAIKLTLTRDSKMPFIAKQKAVTYAVLEKQN
jgi:hypothetical protein